MNVVMKYFGFDRAKLVSGNALVHYVWTINTIDIYQWEIIPYVNAGAVNLRELCFLNLQL